MKINYLLVGALWCLSQVGLTQPIDSIRNMMASPSTGAEQLHQTIENYISGGGTDPHILKLYDRYNSFYDAYVGADGKTNDMYPSFLIQTSASSQPIPEFIGCSGLPTTGWKSLGPKFINSTEGYNGRLTSIAIDKVNNLIYSGSENGGLWRKTIGTDNWENITNKLGYPALGIQDIAIHPTNPNEIYCATGIHKYQGLLGYGIGLIHTTDGGNTWSRENVSVNTTYNKEAISVAFTPFPPYVVFAGVGNNLYQKSGASWSSVFNTNPTNNPSYREVIRDIKFIAPINGAQRKIIISTQVPSENGSAQIAIRNLNSSNNVIGGWQQVKDVASGLVMHQSGVTHRIAVDVSSSNAQKVYASYTVYGNNGKHLEVIESIDHGTTWEATPIYHNHGVGYYEKADIFRNDIRISKNNDNVYYNATVRFRRSINNGIGGDDWIEKLGIHMDVRDIEIIERNGLEEIWVAHDGGLHRSTNGGDTWILEHKNMVIAEYYDVGVCERDDRMIAGALDNNTHVYYNGVWKRGINHGDGCPAMIFKSNPDYALGYINGSAMLYDFLSNSYSLAHPNDKIGYGLGSPIIQHPIYDDKALIGQNQLYEYTLNGASVQLGTMPKTMINAVAMSYQNENNIYVTKKNEWAETANCFHKTTNKGGNWIDMTSKVRVKKNPTDTDYKNPFFFGVIPTDVVVDRDNDQKLYMSLSGVKDDWFKVLYSPKGGELNSDGSYSWIDFSGSLPNVVVHELEVLDSYPTDVLLAATDIGVYYRVLDGSSDWVCFSNGMPPVTIKNMEVKYCSQELYVATHGQGVFKADISELLNLGEEVAVMNGNIVNWNTNQTHYKDIIIEENATLNITGATISMAGGAKIIVKKGGKLNVSNAILTSYCDAFWGGIEVWSDPNAQTQYCNSGCLVGKVAIQNSTIQNADIAINSDQDAVYVNGGGVINATNVNFLNNRKAIAFAKFENHTPNTSTVIDNASSFKNCTFEIDVNYMFDVKPPRDQMITAWEVRGIQFYGCDFKNTSGQPLEVAGAYLHNAHFVITDYCTNNSIPCSNYKKSTFTHLASGVTALSTGLDYHFVVDNAEFTDCRFGVATSAVDYAVVTNNRFEITNDFIYHKPTAIFLENSDQYTVQENVIENSMTNYAPPEPPIGIPFLGDDRGIVVKNSGAGNNAIYKNTFKDIFIGNTAFGTNYNPDEITDGLEYGCNELAGSKYIDFNIYTVSQLGGIAGAQGGNNRPVDNMFTHNMVDPEGHIGNTGANPMTYYHRADGGGYKFEPTDISGNVAKYDVNMGFIGADHCPSRLGNVMDQNPKGLASGGRSLLIRNDFDGALNAYSQAHYIYVSTIDGGDTYGLLNSVQSSNAQTAWELRTDLINASPLSIEVIMETIEEAVLSNALLHEVIMVNPHAVRNEEVMHLLETKTNPMPAYMINTLLGIYESQTQKDVLEAEMAGEMQNAREAMRQIYMDWRADSINPYDDSLLIYNQELHTPEADWNSVAYQVTKENLEAAQTIKNAIPSKFELGDWATDNYNALNTYYDVWMNLIQNDAVPAPSQSQKATLEQLATKKELKGGRMAKNYLMWLNEETYWPVLPEAPAGKRDFKNPRAPRVEKPQKAMEMYPVPANSYVTLKMHHIDGEIPVHIQVINTSGQVMLTHRDQMQNGALINLMTQNLATGSYFVLIYQNEVVIEKQALEVIH